MGHLDQNHEYKTMTLDIPSVRGGGSHHGVSDEDVGPNMNQSTSSIRQKVLPALVECIDEHFTSSTTMNNLYQQMQRLDSANWRCNEMAELPSMRAVAAEHLAVPLAASGFESEKLQSEWGQLKVIQKNVYEGIDGNYLWEAVLLYRRKQLHPTYGKLP